MNFKKLGFMQGRLSPIFRHKIQSFPYSNWKNEFKLATKLKLNHIEWTADQFLIDRNPINYKEGIKEIIEIKKKYKLNIPSLTADFIMQEPFYKAENLVVKSLEEQFIQIIINASKVGIKNIVVPLVDNGRIETSSQKRKIIIFFKKINKLITKSKIKICFELDMKPKNCKNFIDIFDNNNFGINYDIGNSASKGFNPKEEIILYGNRIFNVHIKDRNLNGPTVPLGKGNADFDLVFGELKKLRYKNYFTIQMSRSKNNLHIAEIKKTIKYLQKYFYKY